MYFGGVLDADLGGKTGDIVGDNIGDGTLIDFSDGVLVTFAGTPGCADGVSVGCGDGVAIAFGGGSGGVAIWVLAVSTATAAVATGPSLLAGVGAALTSTRDDADSSLAALTGDMCALAGAAMAASLVSSPFTHGSTTSSRPTASSAQPSG